MSDDKTMADAVDEVLEGRNRHPLVWIEDGFYIVRDERAPGFRYDFDCRSPADALCWIEHLAGKTWITKEHLERFASLVIEQFGVKRR